MSTVIKVENLSKRYRLGVVNRDMLYKDLQSRWAKFRGKEDPNAPIGLKHDKRLEHGDEFWALRNVDLEVKEGEILGIIGRNGAGKSTLLKILSQITAPTEGKIKVKGRIASLLEVGTGFHPELTGRENVYLNGAILGMTRKEIRSKFDEIVAFAEIDEFIDTPVKRYSSGMYVRLAFAVAAHLDPEILIVDEVLAVGDAQFQKKCLGKMENVAGLGRTILFVSHNLQAVKQLCATAVWLDNGAININGSASDIVRDYLEAQIKPEGIDSVNRAIIDLPPDPDFLLRSVDVVQDGKSSTVLKSGEPSYIIMNYRLCKPYEGFHVYIQLCDMDGSIIMETISNGHGEKMPYTQAGEYTSSATIPADFLSCKRYEIRFLAGIHSYRNLLPRDLSLQIDVHASGKVNRAYAGYSAPGLIAPLIHWENIIHTNVSNTTNN